MEKGWKVEFRNVSSSYFPQSRVECHYSISSQHSWSSSDWIGLFKVGWSSVQNYHTFVWALAPANYQEASDVNCCVHFQACYLPGPGAEQYQFVYVDAKGEVVSQSSTFTFSAPKPLEELETLEEPVEVGEDLLLVVSRAEMLQGHLEECLKEREELFRTLTVANRSREHEREKADRVGKELQQKCDELLQDNHELRKQLRSNLQEAQRMKKEMESLAETLKVEKTVAQAEKVDAEMTIAQLEKDIKALNQRGLEREAELERMRERARKAASQKKEEESECKNLKLKLEQTEKELHSLSTEFQSLRSSMAQRDTQVLQLRDTIANLTQKLNNAQKKEAASEAALAELQVFRERLEASERCVESLRSELREIGFQRDSVQGERHQARMQAAQLTLQLADVTMALGEGRASWAQERENLLQTVETERKRLDRLNDEIQQMEERLREERMKREIAELELGREKDCNRVQLSETRRELQEQRTSLGVAQKEKEQLKTEKQEVIDHLQQLQQRLEALNVSKWSVTALLNSASLDSSMSESEDENPEALQESHNPGALSRYGLCDQQGSERLLPATPPPSPRHHHHHASSLDHGVVISQPAPLNSPCQPGAEVLGHSSESEEEYEVPQSGGNSSGEETALLLLDHQDTALSDLAESPLW